MVRAPKRTYDPGAIQRCNDAYSALAELLELKTEMDGLGTYPPNGLYISVSNAEKLIELARNGKESNNS